MFDPWKLKNHKFSTITYVPIELKFLIRYLGTLYVLAMSMLASSKFLFYTQIFFYLPLAEFFEFLLASGPQPPIC